jgi:drug/metabolite transporter (DMT)-like permease
VTEPAAEKGAGLGLTLVLVAAVLFSFKGILAKLIYAEGVDVPTLLALRFAIALPLVWIIAARAGMGRRPPTGPELLAVMVGGAIGFGLAPIFDFIALELIHVSVERVLLFTFPAFVVLYDSIRLRRPPTVRQWQALVITQVGIVLTMGGLDVDLLLENLAGSLWAVASAAVYAIYLMVNQRYGRQFGAARFTAWGMTAGTATAFLYFIVQEPLAALAVTPLAYGYIAVISAFCTVIPMVMLTEGIRRVGAARAALLSTAGPPFTVAMAALILGETLTVQQIAGGCVVILGVLVLEGRVRLPRLRAAAVPGD